MEALLHSTTAHLCIFTKLGMDSVPNGGHSNLVFFYEDLGSHSNENLDCGLLCCDFYPVDSCDMSL